MIKHTHNVDDDDDDDEKYLKFFERVRWLCPLRHLDSV